MAKPAPAYLDSSFIVRYLTNEPPALAERATAVLDGEETLLLCETILMESAYVLEKVYEHSREEVVAALSELVQKANISLAHLPKPLVLEALQLCRHDLHIRQALPGAGSVDPPLSDGGGGRHRH